MMNMPDIKGDQIQTNTVETNSRPDRNNKDTVTRHNGLTQLLVTFAGVTVISLMVSCSQISTTPTEVVSVPSSPTATVPPGGIDINSLHGTPEVGAFQWYSVPAEGAPMYRLVDENLEYDGIYKFDNPILPSCFTNVGGIEYAVITLGDGNVYIQGDSLTLIESPEP
jgi:hypothetical protein